QESELLYGLWDELPRDQDVAILNEYRPILDEFDSLVSTGWLAAPLNLPRPSNDENGASRSLLEIPLFSELTARSRIGTLNLMALRVAAENGDWEEVVERFRFGILFGAHDRRPLMWIRHSAAWKINWMFED